jgi:SAM-dependent methyltransferase
MKQGLQAYLYGHTYPDFLWKHPGLIRLLHRWNLLFLQRNKAVREAMSALLPDLPPGTVVLDAGCGDGQHLLPWTKRFPHLQFWGLDKDAGNVVFCEHYARKAGYENTLFFVREVEQMQLGGQADLLLSVGVLQYLREDDKAMAEFYETLRPGGILLLYLPVNGRSLLPGFRFFYRFFNHYDKQQGKKRIYLPCGLTAQLSAAGFKISSIRHTYGRPGIVGHELYSLLLIAAGNAGTLAGLFILPGLLLLPLALLLVQLDYCLPPARGGNGMLLTAIKPGKDSTAV